jgi:hypothetical protein
MKKFSDFITEEEKDDESASDEGTRKSLINIIANNLNRLKTSDKADVKNMLMMIAALSLLNTKDTSGLTLNTARKLASSMSATSKK